MARIPLGRYLQAFSLCACPLEMQFGDTKLGVGSGFFYRHNGTPYLITNWHNVMGRDPSTGLARAADSVVPDRISAVFSPITDLGAVRPSEGRKLETPLDGEWLMHQEGQKIDIAALPLVDEEIGDGSKFPCVNDVAHEQNAHIEVGQEIFILGFPRGLRPTFHFPIWKRGSIATEPRILPNGEPWLLVDAASREGMSGSLVLASAMSVEDNDALAQPFGLQTPINLRLGKAIVGVYSGRVGSADAFEAALGKFWLISAVEEMLEHPRTINWERLC